MKNLFERLIQHTIAPYFALILVIVGEQLSAVSDNKWQSFLLLCVIVSVQMLPILYCKYRSLAKKNTKWQSIRWWILGFIFCPFVLLVISNNMPKSDIFFSASYEQFLWLWFVEAFLLTKNWLVFPAMKKLKFTPTIDNVLFIAVVAFSLFWALVFNSIDNPVENQPIHIIIDIKRNFLNFGLFLEYFIQFFIMYFCLYFIYWINHHWLVNKVLAEFGFFNYLWLALIFVLLAVPVLSQLVLFLPMNTAEFTFIPSQNYDPFDVWNYRIGFIVMVMSSPLILAFKWQEKSKQVIELEKENIKNELLSLQQQINPHFLFNTLNNLYSLTLTKSEQAPDMVLQLANLLRFVVYQGSQPSVKLKDEITYLEGYLTLQQVRVSHKCRFNVSFPQHIPDLVIAPLLLINLIENAFKHGVEPSENMAELTVSMQIDNNIMQFSCTNSVANVCSDAESGIGLQNMRRRLELLYPERHQLILTEKDGRYEASLTLELSA